jgi:hypothetical protein
MPAVGNSVAFQVAIASTGVPQQLPANALQNGGTLAAKTGNTAAVSISPNPAVTATTGFLLGAGQQAPFTGSNTNQLWVVGTAADVISFLGN